MKKTKSFQLSLGILLSTLLIISCETPAPVTKSSSSNTVATIRPSPSPTSYIKKVRFTNRSQSFTFLKCLIGTAELSEPQPSLLERDINNMEKGQPLVSDSVAIEIYTKHINDILRIYPSTWTSCKSLDYIDANL